MELLLVFLLGGSFIYLTLLEESLKVKERKNKM